MHRWSVLQIRHHLTPFHLSPSFPLSFRLSVYLVLYPQRRLHFLRQSALFLFGCSSFSPLVPSVPNLSQTLTLLPLVVLWIRRPRVSLQYLQHLHSVLSVLSFFSLSQSQPHNWSTWPSSPPDCSLPPRSSVSSNPMKVAKPYTSMFAPLCAVYRVCSTLCSSGIFAGNQGLYVAVEKKQG